MSYRGACNCTSWQLQIMLDKKLKDLNPRVCDCSYCQSHPSRILSSQGMCASLTGRGALIRQNGDKLANFYHCRDCNDLLAVGCVINGVLRGAVNADLLLDSQQLGDPVAVQPRLLSPDEKLERWGQLWGVLSGLEI